MMAYCERCDRRFGSESAFNQHRVDSPHHNFCGDCCEEFSTSEGLEKHWFRTARHSYCQYCEVHFEYPSGLEVHCKKRHSYCRSCNRVFVDQDILRQHYSQSSRHHYCLSCEKHFRSENNLRNHMNSSIHRAKNVACPFSGCDMKFVSRSALALHLETGTCKSGIDRDTIDSNARHYDIDNIITDPSCPHYLGSPDYICPDGDSGCRKGFTTFSALCQHIESERCGAFRSKTVWRIIDIILGRRPPLIA